MLDTDSFDIFGSEDESNIDLNLDKQCNVAQTAARQMFYSTDWLHSDESSA